MYYGDKPHMVGFRLPDEDYMFLIAVALERDCTISKVCQDIIADYRRKEGNPYDSKANIDNFI